MEDKLPPLKPPFDVEYPSDQPLPGSIEGRLERGEINRKQADLLAAPFAAKSIRRASKPQNVDSAPDLPEGTILGTWKNDH